MKRFKFLAVSLVLIVISLTTSMFIGSFSSSALCESGINVSPISIAAGLLAAGILVALASAFVPGFNHRRSANAIAVEIWVDYIIGNLWKNNEFLNYCFNESDSVLNGAVVHIPQAGAKPATAVNRSSLPASVVQRTDTDVTYALDVFSTDPTLITNAEARQISYDKINSVLSEHVQSLNDLIGDHVCYRWAPTVTGQILRTTGSASATALAPSATGTRLALIKEDLKRAQALMDKQGIPKDGRYALIPVDMFQQLMDDSDLKVRDANFGGELNIRDGNIPKLYNFTIITRANTVIYDAATPPQPKAVGASGATTDNLAVLCWQKDCVAKALGSVNFYERLQDPTYYGDVYSAEVKMGARKRRSGGEGVIAIVQA